MTKVQQLTTPEEFKEMLRYLTEPNQTLAGLTWSELSPIALILMRTEYENSKTPKVILAAEAIRILTNRAIKQNLPIF